MNDEQHRQMKNQLIAAVNEQDQRPMRAFYDRYFGSIYRYVLCRVDGNHADTEEIVGEVFYQAFRDIERYNAKNAPDAWLRGIARHRVLDFYRRNKRKPVIELAFDKFDAEMAEHFMNLDAKELHDDALKRDEVSTLVELALSDLPEGYEQVLRLKYLENKAVNDIATVLKDTPKAVEARLHRARLAFRDAFRVMQQHLAY